jgi:uncharacterized protein YodC (DUF2158 family)
MKDIIVPRSRNMKIQFVDKVSSWAEALTTALEKCSGYFGDDSTDWHDASEELQELAETGELLRVVDSDDGHDALVVTVGPTFLARQVLRGLQGQIANQACEKLFHVDGARLKSGGPKMKLVHTDKGRAYCKWTTDTGDERREWFDAEELEPWKEDASVS